MSLGAPSFTRFLGVKGGRARNHTKEFFYSLFPIPWSLFPGPYSLVPIPWFLFPGPYSLPLRSRGFNAGKSVPAMISDPLAVG